MIVKAKIGRVFALLSIWLAWNLPDGAAQNRPPTVRTAYSALSAGIGTLWLSHDEGYFKKHGLDSNLIDLRGGSTAVQALLAGDMKEEVPWRQTLPWVWDLTRREIAQVQRRRARVRWPCV